ncbi:MAG: hypothetical protein HY885_18570 [Deltaproteobacteria bacterium]|nr:hypothetical protein [Deltaproteobacteria bacterium]
MKYTSLVVFIAAVMSIFAPGAILAEEIKNFSDCDTCQGGIHYGANEARKIVGAEGYQAIQVLRKSQKRVKIDLDGAMALGSENDADTGYEITIWGFDPVFIKSLRDDSSIQLVTDAVRAQNPEQTVNWSPEVYLYAQEADEIHMKDSVSVGWEKMRASHIYQWIISGEEKPDDIKACLHSKIIYALKGLSSKNK